MQPSENLRKKMEAIDGRDYGSCQSLLGEYAFYGFKLAIQQIPKDPYAPPHTGIYRLWVPHELESEFPDMKKSRIVEVAIRDFLARYFFQATGKFNPGRRGTGFSGIITIDEPGQAILERSSIVFSENQIEVRFFMGLPASGRKINAKVAEKMFFDELPQIVEQSLFKKNIDIKKLSEHIKAAEDADCFRSQLGTLGLVAFVANGALLPRKSGTSDKPLDGPSVIPFKSPIELEIEMKSSSGEMVRGMGIPKGITLITGGGYHGKSTLLHAIELGIYNHIPGDGREQCVSNRQSVKIRATSGRYIEKVDISTFIKNLPLKQDTTSFSTENASGSTSQAASIMEAVEMDAEVLLMDEDTCATNFMIRDHKMQQLVHKDDEPITPFIDRARQLYSIKGISSILVLGGSGDYFDISDTVIQMNRYKSLDVSEEAKKIAAATPVKRAIEDVSHSITPKERIPIPDTIDPTNQYNKVSLFSKEVFRINFGKTIIDLSDIEQLMELSQTKAIAQAILTVKDYADGRATLKEIIHRLEQDLEKGGLDILSSKVSGHFAQFRGIELASALNRLRGMEVQQNSYDS